MQPLRTSLTEQSVLTWPIVKVTIRFDTFIAGPEFSRAIQNKACSNMRELQAYDLCENSKLLVKTHLGPRRFFVLPAISGAHAEQSSFASISSRR